MKISLFVVLFFAGIYSCHAQNNNCIPYAFNGLQNELGEKSLGVKYWESVLKTDKYGTDLNNSIDIWNGRESHKLDCIYSILKDQKVNDAPLVFNIPYLWIGFPDKRYVSGRPAPHAALVFFYKEIIKIENYDENGKVIVVEFLDYRTFFNRTINIYKYN